MTIHPLLAKAMRSAMTGVFLLLSITVYMAYYHGLVLLFGEFVSNFFIVLALVLTYMFRMDVIAASLAFYGAWQGWHVVMWQAIVVCAVFVVWSIYRNHGDTTKIKDFVGRVSAEERPADAVANSKPSE